VLKGHGPSQEGQSGIVKAIEAVLIENVLAEMLKHVRQQQNVRHEVKIVIFAKIADIEMGPNFLGALIVFYGKQFVVKGIVKFIDWRKLSLLEFSTAVDIGIRIDALGEGVQSVTDVFGGVGKVVLAAFQKERDQIFERS